MARNKTNGQIIDELTIAIVRRKITGLDFDEDEYLSEVGHYIENRSHTYKSYSKLLRINEEIWRQIDFIMLPRSIVSLILHSMDIARAAIRVQMLNEERTNLIRQIDATTGSNTVSRKVYGGNPSV
jgi:hypothetical protein